MGKSPTSRSGDPGSISGRAPLTFFSDEKIVHVPINGLPTRTEIDLGITLGPCPMP